MVLSTTPTSAHTSVFVCLLNNTRPPGSSFPVSLRSTGVRIVLPGQFLSTSPRNYFASQARQTLPARASPSRQVIESQDLAGNSPNTPLLRATSRGRELYAALPGGASPGPGYFHRHAENRKNCLFSVQPRRRFAHEIARPAAAPTTPAFNRERRRR
jgi:hypothetical protein